MLVSTLVSLLLVGILKSGNANQHFSLPIAQLLSPSGGVTAPGGLNRHSDEVLRDTG